MWEIGLKLDFDVHYDEETLLQKKAGPCMVSTFRGPKGSRFIFDIPFPKNNFEVNPFFIKRIYRSGKPV